MWGVGGGKEELREEKERRERKEGHFKVIHCYFQVTGLSDVLIDYYITATDTRGNMKKTDIYHVYVGKGTSTCGN